MAATQKSGCLQEYTLGHARVALDHLFFDSGVRDFDEKNVERLQSVFRTEGCHREDPMHFIPALISKATLSPTWTRSDQPQALQLDAGVLLRCLHGKHRVLAALRFFRPRDQWWTLTLYDADLPVTVSDSAIESFKNELRFSDGDCFRYYRHAQRGHDRLAEGRWLARLSVTKRRNLRQLEKVDSGRIIEAFDDLLPYVGLWQDFHLGALNRVLPMRLWQEILRYLGRLLELWQHVLGNHQPALLTPQTVSALQLLAPSLALADEERVIAALKSSAFTSGTRRHTIFPGISDEGERQGLLERLLLCPRILSFHSFFEDTIYLEVCHASLKWLLPDRQAYERSFETAFSDLYRGSERVCYFDYLQLWLFAMRHFPELSDIAGSRPRKDVGKPKPGKVAVNTHVRRALVSFAEQLGFQINPVDIDASGSPVIISDDTSGSKAPFLSTDAIDTTNRARCNRPFERSFRTDRKYLFIEHLYAKQATDRGEYITTFSVARDFVHCFWGSEHPSPPTANAPTGSATGPTSNNVAASSAQSTAAEADPPTVQGPGLPENMDAMLGVTVASLPNRHEGEHGAINARVLNTALTAPLSSLPMPGTPTSEYTPSETMIHDPSTPAVIEASHGSSPTEVGPILPDSPEPGLIMQIPPGTISTLRAQVALPASRTPPETGHTDPAYGATHRSHEEELLFEDEPSSVVRTRSPQPTRRKRRAGDLGDGTEAVNVPFSDSRESLIQDARAQLAEAEGDVWYVLNASEGKVQTSFSMRDLETYVDQVMDGRDDHSLKVAVAVGGIPGTYWRLVGRNDMCQALQQPGQERLLILEEKDKLGRKKLEKKKKARPPTWNQATVQLQGRGECTLRVNNSGDSKLRRLTLLHNDKYIFETDVLEIVVRSEYRSDEATQCISLMWTGNRIEGLTEAEGLVIAAATDSVSGASHILTFICRIQEWSKFQASQGELFRDEEL